MLPLTPLAPFAPRAPPSTSQSSSSQTGGRVEPIPLMSIPPRTCIQDVTAFTPKIHILSLEHPEGRDMTILDSIFAASEFTLVYAKGVVPPADQQKIRKTSHEDLLNNHLEYAVMLDMGTLAPESKSLGSDIYLSLGLKEMNKETPGNPRVLLLLSSLLERSVQKNEMLLETARIKDVVTIFHGSRAPSLGIQQYIDRIFKYSCCSPSCFVVAHIYVERFIQRMSLHLTSLNVHRLLITGLMVAAKFIDDAFFNNAYYARVGGVSTAELNKLEMKFLFGLDFRLHVSVQTFGKHCSQLEKEATSGIQIERPILACRTKESWSSKDDSSCPSTIAR